MLREFISLPLVVFLLILCGFYSTYKLSESPPTWFDEGIYIQAAQSLVDTGMQRIQTAPGITENTAYVSGGYSFLLPIGLSHTLFGNSLLSARIAMVFFIMVFAFLCWYMSYRLFGRTQALLSLLLIVTFPILYGNGKNVLGEVPGMVYLLLALLSILSLEESRWRGALRYATTGLLIALTAVAKPIFFLFPIAVIATGVFRFRLIGIKNAMLTFITGCIPFGIWIYLQFGGVYALAPLFSHYANPYAESSLLHTMLGNAGRFFTEATPLYAALLFFVWGVALLIRRYSQVHITTAEWIGFMFSFLILITYLRTAGWYRYFFEAMLLGLMFLPSALRTIMNWLSVRYPRFARFTVCVPIAVLLLGLFQFYQLNTSSWVATQYHSDQTAILETYFATFKPESTVLLYNVPQIVPFLSNANYYQYFEIEPTGALAYGKENLNLLFAATPGIVITKNDIWEARGDLFPHYQKRDELGAYVVLVRR